MAGRVHQERGAGREAKLPDRRGRGGDGKQEREVDPDPARLGLAGKVDSDDGPECQAEAPVEIGQRPRDQDREHENLPRAAGQPGQSGHQVLEQGRRPQRGTEDQDQRHLHREREHHPEPPVIAVGHGSRGISERQGGAGHEEHHHDGRGHRIRDEPADGEGKPGQAVGRCGRCGHGCPGFGSGGVAGAKVGPARISREPGSGKWEPVYRRPRANIRT